MRPLLAVILFGAMIGGVSAANSEFNKKSNWLLVAEGKDGSIYRDMRTIRLYSDEFSNNVVHWEKKVLNKPARIEGFIYDEVYELVNVNCDRKALKIDERAFQLKGKTVYRLNRDSYYLPTYMYPEPGSVDMLRVDDSCYAGEKLKEVGFNSFGELLDSMGE